MISQKICKKSELGIRETLWWAAQNYIGINSFSLGPTSGNTSNNYDNDWQTFWCLWFRHSIPLHCWIVSYKDQKYSNRHLLHYRQSHTSQVRNYKKNTVMPWQAKWVSALAYFDPKLIVFSIWYYLINFLVGKLWFCTCFVT